MPFTVDTDPIGRVVHVRMHGAFMLDEMSRFSREYKSGTDLLGGRPHIVVADMRGMKTLTAECAKEFGDAIGYARKRGVAHCVHISDTTITKLQAARVARQNSPSDDVTVDVVSIEEAQKLTGELQAALPGK